MMVVFGTILIQQDSEFSGFDKMSAKVLRIIASAPSLTEIFIMSIDSN